MASSCKIINRGISTSSVLLGKRNFRKFLLYNKRGTVQFKKSQTKNPDPDIPIDNRGLRHPGHKIDDKFVMIPEMVPELIVPYLKDFKLKPYVTYKSIDVVQSEFTAQDLFNVVYAQKIEEDFAQNKLTENGEPTDPSEFEKLTPQEAKDRAGKTGSDLFTQRVKPMRRII